MDKTLIVIPSRLGSTRLIRKPLLMIENKPMLVWCVEQAIKAKCGDVYVACDSDEISELCKSNGFKYIMTSPEIPTGSDRVFIASEMIGGDYEFIVNLQGDMPKIKPETIELTVDALKQDFAKDFDVMSAITNFENDEEKIDINNVSAIVAHKDKDELKEGDVVSALYFTRTSEPFAKSVYKHIGIYVYRSEALKNFISLRQSKLELEERLEQLRALENGMTVGCVFVNDHVISVDTQQDLERIMKN
jgi:3-deoxy-manno-octulosonate cytidylyltransferase (CMP-KDO synthetase)